MPSLQALSSDDERSLCVFFLVQASCRVCGKLKLRSSLSSSPQPLLFSSRSVSHVSACPKTEGCLRGTKKHRLRSRAKDPLPNGERFVSCIARSVCQAPSAQSASPSPDEETVTISSLGITWLHVVLLRKGSDQLQIVCELCPVEVGRIDCRAPFCRVPGSLLSRKSSTCSSWLSCAEGGRLVLWKCDPATLSRSSP